MEKSHGNPVPVNTGSSQVPSSVWFLTSQATPPRVASLSCSPAASRARRAQAVCEAVDSPRPRQLSSTYERRSSPHPPSSFWCSSSQVTARRIRGSAGSIPAAASAGTTAPVPYT